MRLVFGWFGGDWTKVYGFLKPCFDTDGFDVCTRSNGKIFKNIGIFMSLDRGEVLVSRYRPLIIATFLLPVLSYLVHAAFGWVVVPVDYIRHFPTTALPDARLSESWNSLMAISYLQLSITGLLLIYILVRQFLSAIGFSQISRVESVSLIFAVVVVFFMVLFSGPINPDLLFMDDPKVRGDAKWIFIFVVSFVSGGVSSLIVAMVVDPNTLNENFKKSQQR